MEYKPDTIKVSVSHQEEVFAVRADLYVTVKGSSLMGGHEAFKKAREVNQLLEALKQAGAGEEAVTLQGVNISAATGAVLKSSAASYRLKIRCEDLTRFADMLDAIASQKNAALTRVEWQYDDDAARERMTLAMLEKAGKKAAKMAQSLGVTLLGVYDLSENVYDEETPMQFPALAKARSAPVEPEPSLGMDVQHFKTIRAHVEIWYRVSGF